MPLRPRAARLVQRLEGIRRRLHDAELRLALTGFGPSEASARNLIHYLALRRLDLRALQTQLADLGLSSLGRAEGHVLYNVEAVLARLRSIAGPAAELESASTALTPAEGRRTIVRNSLRLFGPPRPGRATRIMVTVPAEAARRPSLVRELLEGGMDCMRINCAHDTPAEWARMIRNLRSAVRATGQPCCVEMDLGGPRLRTGAIEARPGRIRVRPGTDPRTGARVPARIAFVVPGSTERPVRGVEAQLAVSSSWLGRRRSRERLRLIDARGLPRRLRIVTCTPLRAVATVGETTHFANGLRIEGRTPRGGRDVELLERIPERPGRIRLAPGDLLALSRRPVLGHGCRAEAGRVRSSATVGVSLPELLERVRPGERVWFDGGRIGGVVRSRSSAGLLVRIDHAAGGASSLRADQGINLPESELDLLPLTDRDRSDLRFVARHADLVGYSFVQSPSDLEELRKVLRGLGRPDLGIVLKIETRRAFEQLPAILLGGLRSGPTGVMIARGDLAVEVGFERLAEVQEEALWLCEAAHVPSVWATEVLEGLARVGRPTRAEVTDAAMGERAECVMLNKGPYLPQAVRALDSILRRMQAHQAKKSARLRHLSVAERFLEDTGPGSPVKPPASCPSRPNARGRRTAGQPT